MIGMIVLYIKIFRVLYGQMSKLLVWLTEVKSNDGRCGSQNFVFDSVTTNGNDNGTVRAAASTASSTSTFHQQTGRCSTIGSLNNVTYIHHPHSRLNHSYGHSRTTNNTCHSPLHRDLIVSSQPMPTDETKQRFRRVVHAIVWLGRTRETSSNPKGSFKEYREHSLARSHKKLFYNSAWSSTNAHQHHALRRNRNATYQRAIATTDSLLQRQISVARREQQQKMRLAKQRRVARTLGVLIFVFLVSWLPFTILLPVQRFFGVKYVSNSLLRKTLWLTYANTFINPFLYFFSNNDFRYALRRILKCCLRQNAANHTNIQIK
jgi:hypothetical protein